MSIQRLHIICVLYAHKGGSGTGRLDDIIKKNSYPIALPRCFQKYQEITFWFIQFHLFPQLNSFPVLIHIKLQMSMKINDVME